MVTTVILLLATITLALGVIAIWKPSLQLRAGRSSWPVLVFALLVLVTGLTIMTTLKQDNVTAADVAALAAAVLGVVGTHVGHITGHQLATGDFGRHEVGQADIVQYTSILERLADLRSNEHLDDAEFQQAKQNAKRMLLAS
jgi:hypothetical protein